jgi:hypothetical protein
MPKDKKYTLTPIKGKISVTKFFNYMHSTCWVVNGTMGTSNGVCAETALMLASIKEVYCERATSVCMEFERH